MRALLILILICATLHAETPSEALNRRRLEYPELTQIVEIAQSAPPEFAAKALLRVAQSPSLRDQSWKRELLDQAFQTAASARNPIGRRIRNGMAADGSREQRIAEAAEMGLDRLTLQSQAVNAMQALNPKRAVPSSKPRPSSSGLRPKGSAFLAKRPGGGAGPPEGGTPSTAAVTRRAGFLPVTSPPPRRR